MKTTLNKIREHSPCTDGWCTLLTHLGKTKADDEPLSIATILDSNGLNDALWCLRAVEGKDKEIRLFAVWCARQVQHLMTDQRSLDALDVAEKYANGDATEKEMDAARSDSRDAAREVAEDTARFAADSAMFAAEDAADAVADAAYTVWAARSAAGAAAWAAADAARDAAWGVAWDAAYAATRAKQEVELRRICGEVEG